jgi:hypothetical protein
VATLLCSALVAAPAIASAQQSGNRNGAEAQQRAQVERSQRDLDRDRLRDRDRITDPAQDRDRIQDRTHAPDEAKQAEERVYGHELMTDAERLAYQERLKNAATAEEREQVMAQHREEIQVRARNRNIQIDDKGNPVRED